MDITLKEVKAINVSRIQKDHIAKEEFRIITIRSQDRIDRIELWSDEVDRLLFKMEEHRLADRESNLY